MEGEGSAVWDDYIRYINPCGLQSRRGSVAKPGKPSGTGFTQAK